MVAWREDWSAGRATLTTVPSMKAMLEPRIVAARIQAGELGAGREVEGGMSGVRSVEREARRGKPKACANSAGRRRDSRGFEVRRPPRGAQTTRFATNFMSWLKPRRARIGKANRRVWKYGRFVTIRKSELVDSAEVAVISNCTRCRLEMCV